jgi:hypothetical protein
MSELELIGKQQLEIEHYKKLVADLKDILDSLHGDFYAIGRPLNDNVLQFNINQLKYLQTVANQVESASSLIEAFENDN